MSTNEALAQRLSLIAQMQELLGADKFRAFIRSEVIPYVENHYRTAPFRILAGHSVGGLFAIDTLARQPDLVHVYLAVSPSLWWDRGALVPVALLLAVLIALAAASAPSAPSSSAAFSG